MQKIAIFSNAVNSSRKVIARAFLGGILAASMLGVLLIGGGITLPGAQAADPQILTGSADPGIDGQYQVQVGGYDLGDEAVTLPALPGKAMELRGESYLPVGASGPRPMVLLMHGGSNACVNPQNSKTSQKWPCSEGETAIPSYQGYADLGKKLASQGYAVFSLSANGLNVVEGPNANDAGSLARAQLVQKTLELLSAANRGEAPPLLGTDISGRLDLNNVGLMGHSRGGEGMVRAALLNSQQGRPYGINAVFQLAPDNTGGLTLPNVPMAMLLPYCDGDLRTMPGQRSMDSSRYAFDTRDNVLRTSMLLMGANHTYFNSVWNNFTYPYTTGDDWNVDKNPDPQGTYNGDSTCGYGPNREKPNAETRLTDTEQSTAGVAYMAGFFRLTLGKETQFMPLYDGSGAKAASTGRADIRVSATAPSSERRDLARFENTDPNISVTEGGSAELCSGLDSQRRKLPACLKEGNESGQVSQDQTPHWASDLYGWGLPTLIAQKFRWDKPAPGQEPSELRVKISPQNADASGFENLSVRLAPDVEVSKSTDLTITVVDRQGASQSFRVSELSDALKTLPGAGPEPDFPVLPRIWLQQVNLPLDRLTDVDLRQVAEIRFTGDKAAEGGVFLSDLSLVKKMTTGTVQVVDRPEVSVTNAVVEEGEDSTTAYVAVRLSKPSSEVVTTWLSNKAPGQFPGLMEANFNIGQGGKVVFPPGKTCVSVPVTLPNLSTAERAAMMDFPTLVSLSTNATISTQASGKISVRSKTPVTDAEGKAVPPAPPVGIQGDACAEAEASPGKLTVEPAEVKTGKDVTIHGTGYRIGEEVTIYRGSVVIGTVISKDGTISYTFPSGTEAGTFEIKAVGAGSGYTNTAKLTVTSPDNNGQDDDKNIKDDDKDNGSAEEQGAGGADGVDNADSQANQQGEHGLGNRDRGADNFGTAASSGSGISNSGQGFLATTGASLFPLTMAALVLLAGAIIFLVSRSRRNDPYNADN